MQCNGIGAQTQSLFSSRHGLYNEGHLQPYLLHSRTCARRNHLTVDDPAEYVDQWPGCLTTHRPQAKHAKLMGLQKCAGALTLLAIIGHGLCSAPA